MGTFLKFVKIEKVKKKCRRKKLPKKNKMSIFSIRSKQKVGLKLARKTHLKKRCAHLKLMTPRSAGVPVYARYLDARH